MLSPKRHADVLIHLVPRQTRYSVKFRAIDGKLTLKITDDVHVSSPTPPRHLLSGEDVC
jgi:hypothetical protein